MEAKNKKQSAAQFVKEIKRRTRRTFTSEEKIKIVLEGMRGEDTIAVILLTALSESDKQVGGYKTGADAYITKPFDENILIAQIESLIRARA